MVSMSEGRHNVVEADNVTHGDADDSGQCTIGWEPGRANTHSLGSSGSGMVFALSETPSGRFRRDGVPGRQDVQLGRELLTQGWMNGVEPALTQVADTNATVVIRGEAGVGKGLVATLIHSTSPGASDPSSPCPAHPVPRRGWNRSFSVTRKERFPGP
jgi:hypothetical protein